MENDFNERLNNVLKYLGISEDNISCALGYKTEDGVESIPLIREKIRKKLGVDKTCYQCEQFKFIYDLTPIEGQDYKICQDCLEDIVEGRVKLRE